MSALYDEALLRKASPQVRLLVSSRFSWSSVKPLNWPILSYFELVVVGSSKRLYYQTIWNVLPPPPAPYDDGVCHGVFDGALV